MLSFEIQTFNGGKWKMDSVYDDWETCLLEAKKVDESGRYSGVRAIEENYDKETNQATTRILFRGGNVTDDKPQKAASAPKSQKSGKSGKSKPRGGNGGASERKGGSSRNKKKSSLLVPVLVLLVVIIGGVIALIALK